MSRPLYLKKSQFKKNKRWPRWIVFDPLPPPKKNGNMWYQWKTTFKVVFHQFYFSIIGYGHWLTIGFLFPLLFPASTSVFKQQRCSPFDHVEKIINFEHVPVGYNFCTFGIIMPLVKPKHTFLTGAGALLKFSFL